MTTEHPPNKGEIYRIGGINTVASLMKAYPDNLEIIRYALKLLHNLIGDDVQTKYSLASARQICLHQVNLVEIILAAKKKFPDDAHVSTISSATLKLIASTMS